MRHLEVGNAAGIEALTRRAASAVVTSPAGQAEQVAYRLHCSFSVSTPFRELQWNTDKVHVMISSKDSALECFGHEASLNKCKGAS